MCPSVHILVSKHLRVGNIGPNFLSRAAVFYLWYHIPLRGKLAPTVKDKTSLTVVVQPPQATTAAIAPSMWTAYMTTDSGQHALLEGTERGDKMEHRIYMARDMSRLS